MTEGIVHYLQWKLIYSLSAPTDVQFYVLCILLLIFSYMLRRYRHPQGAYTNVIKTYSNTVFFGCVF
jgi:hypothetical protein